MGGQASALSVKLENPSCVRVDSSSDTEMALTDVAVAVDKDTYKQQGRVRVKVSMPSTMTRLVAKAPQGQMEHHGILLQNAFDVQVKQTTYKFQYLLLHVLRQRNDATKAKLDAFFCNDKNLATLRLSMLVGSRVAAGVGVPETATRPLRELAREVHHIISPTFMREYRQGIQELALDNTSQTSCLIATIRMRAILLGEDPTAALERQIPWRRGKLLRWAGADLDSLPGVPCSDVFWWTDIETHTDIRGRVYKLQVHKAAKSSFVTTARKHVDWSIHARKYRIIQRKPGANWLEIGRRANWLEIGRSDDLDELKQGLWSTIMHESGESGA